MKQSVTVGAQLLWSGRYSCNNGRYGCTIVMSYIEINKAVSQWLLTFNLCVSVTWPLTCAFHIPCTHTPEIIDMHRGMCDNSAKYLGVTIHSDFQCCRHVDNIAARANGTLHFIHRNLKYCPRFTRETAYCSLVRSTLEYCCRTWDPHLQKDITTLEKVNRRAVRVVFNKSWRDRNVSPTAPMKQLGWQSLENRRYHQRMTMMYNISHGLVAVPPTELVKPQRAPL